MRLLLQLCTFSTLFLAGYHDNLLVHEPDSNLGWREESRDESTLTSRTQHIDFSHLITKTTQSGNIQAFQNLMTTTSMGSNIDQGFNFSYLSLIY